MIPWERILEVVSVSDKSKVRVHSAYVLSGPDWHTVFGLLV
jgi:hypothetical protein